MSSIQSQIQNTMPMTATVNGNAIQGKVSELKDGVSIAQAKEAAKGDGLDQVFIQAKGKNYVVQGDGLDIKSIKKSDKPFVQLYIGDDPVRASLEGLDNEKNTLKEGAWNLGTKIGMGGFVGSVGLAFIGTALEHGPDKGGSAMAGFMFAGISAAVTVGSAVIGSGCRSMIGADVSSIVCSSTLLRSLATAGF